MPHNDMSGNIAQMGKGVNEPREVMMKIDVENL